MTFRVGQKVVCVDVSHDTPISAWFADEPIKGAIYTVTGVITRHDGLALQLIEIRNTPAWGYAFRASRFRPVVERKTSIEIFTAMLTPSDTPRVPANVEAV